MKTRSLLLGALALAGLSTGGYAADLGVVTSLDICDELGLSGLTISSDSNCLVITGEVTFEYTFGDYDEEATLFDFATGDDGDNPTIIYPDTTGTDDYDSDVDIDAWLQFVATSDTDFGPATATIKLLSEDNEGYSDWAVLIDEAWVGIGDTTVLMAGYKSSIFNDGDDEPLNELGLFYADYVDTGVGQSEVDIHTGGAVIQVVSNLGNGVSVAGGLEGLGDDDGANAATDDGDFTAVGVVSYAGDGISAHISGAYNPLAPLGAAWLVHAGFTGTWDPITVVGAFVADSDGYWNALGSAAVTIDIFKLAASVEATDNEFGAGGSVSATFMEGVTLNLSGRYITNIADTASQAEASIEAAITETLTLSAGVGVVSSDFADAGGAPITAGLPGTGAALGTTYYGKAGVAWAPGGGLTAGASVLVTDDGAYQFKTTAGKTIE